MWKMDWDYRVRFGGAWFEGGPSRMIAGPDMCPVLLWWREQTEELEFWSYLTNAAGSCDGVFTRGQVNTGGVYYALRGQDDLEFGVRECGTDRLVWRVWREILSPSASLYLETDLWVAGRNVVGGPESSNLPELVPGSTYWGRDGLVFGRDGSISRKEPP